MMIAAEKRKSTRGNKRVRQVIDLTLRIETLMRDLLAETTASLLDGAHVAVPGSQPALK